jgi:hypothetical protein
MILYKAIKYKILDYCLDVMLSGIVFNFGKSETLGIEHVIAGMKFRKIITTVGEFYDCNVLFVEWWGHLNSYRLIFDFNSTNIPNPDNLTRYKTLIPSRNTGMFYFHR